MAYLDDHKLASSQFRFPRREPISGIVFIHTAESIMDTVGPDTGAENVASFITRRTDPGSYHVLVDSDSTVTLVRDDCESFQVAANGHNRHGFGVSFACRTTDLDPDHPWTQAAMRRAADAILAFWARRGIDPKRGARYLSKADADARRGPGLVTHGDVQPGDRSDAWTRHPRRAELEQMLLDAILAAVPAQSSPTSGRKDTSMFTVTNANGLKFIVRINDAGQLVSSWRENGKRTPWREVIPGLIAKNLGEPLVAGRSIWIPVVAGGPFGEVPLTLIQSEPGGLFEAKTSDELEDFLAGLGKR